MKVTGFTFIRNALLYDYPVEEAIRSILPLCDDFVVAVGNSQDDTLALIRGIAPDKIRIIETIWDDGLREGGRVLAEETNKALRAIAPDTDWCFYIQGDELLHEQYLPAVRAAMQAHLHDVRVDGLLFKYLHFYGSYDYVGASPMWYRHEIRVVRCRPNIYSYRDAQGFRKGADEKLRVKAVDAYIYHYGWVREPEAMQRKKAGFDRLYHDDDWMDKHIHSADAFQYDHLQALRRFEGSHPAVMQARIARKNWAWDKDLSFSRMSWKSRLRMGFERRFGFIPFEYRNYRKI